MINSSNVHGATGHSAAPETPPPGDRLDRVSQGYLPARLCPRAPLGFSDLSEDEALLIWLARRWHASAADRSEIEHALSEDLAADHYAAVLAYVFALLADMPAPSMLPPPGYPLLTPAERALLDLLGTGRNPSHRASDPLSACHAALDAAGIMIRASHIIPTSGIDWLTARIDYGHPLAGADCASY